MDNKLDRAFVPIRKALGYIIGTFVDLFSILFITMGVCVVLEILLPAKLGVAARAMAALATIGVKAEYVPIIIVALIVAYVARSRYSRPSV